MANPDSDHSATALVSFEETIEAYQRSNKEIGIRNRVLVAPSVICSHIVADRIAESVDGAESLPHDHGCAQIGADHEQTEQTLLSLSQNPNVAGTTVVGLGCEHLQSDSFADRIANTGVPVRETAIQDAGGTEACLEKGIEATTALVTTAETVDQTDATLADLTIGIVSSDLEKSTRTVADPLVGEVVDNLLQAGARVLVTGTERLLSGADEAAARAATDEVGSKIRHVAERSVTQPGNVRGIARQAANLPLESVINTWGTTAPSEFVSYGNRASIDTGLAVVDSPSRFEEAATALAAAGASLIIHVTADGIPTGHPAVPVLKVTANRATTDALGDDIDIDARSASPEKLLTELYQIANGGQTATEKHGLTKFAINRVGPSM